MVIKSDKPLPAFPNPTGETRSSFRQALPQVLAVCVKNILLLGFGMTLGFPTILIPSLSNNRDNQFVLDQEAISWIGSINLICVPIGCLLSGPVTQPIGRKRAMQLVNIPFLGAWLLFYFSKEIWQVFLALSVTGVAGGLLEAPTITYVAEIAQPSLRGILTSTSTVAIISGILMQFLLGTFLNWRVVTLINCSVPIISAILFFFVPESPHWLITKNRFLDARKSLAWLRGWTSLEEIEAEFRQLSSQILKEEDKGIDNPAFEGTPKVEEENETDRKWANLRLYTKKNFLWPFSLVSLTFFLGHFAGMSTLQTYAVKIFSLFNSSFNTYYATIGLGIAEVLGCILSACLIHYVGKRVMNFFSLVGCGVCFFVAATYAMINNIRYFDSPTSPSDGQGDDGWLPITLLIGAAFFTHSGIRILPWMLIGEVYSTETRSTASGISGISSYVFSFIANKIFFSMVSVLTISGTFWFYSFVCLVGFILLYFLLPETEGKTLHEITEHFAGNVKLDNKVKRERPPEAENGK